MSMSMSINVGIKVQSLFSLIYIISCYLRYALRLRNRAT